jgi:uncharacterized membrane protein
MNTSEYIDRQHNVEDARYAFENMPRHHVNVGEPERWMSTVGGAGMVLYGLKTRGLLGLTLGAIGASLIYRGTTGHCAAYSQLGISTAEYDRTRAPLDGQNSIKVEESMFVAADQVTLYKFWRNLSNLPHVMSHLEAVTEQDSKRSHWKAKAPLGTSVEWDAEIINETENELIAWRSLEGSTVANAGSVRFIKDTSGAGTTVKVTLMYHPPAGKVGGYVAKLLGEEPSVQIAEDLKKFKTMAEAGKLNGAMSY